MNFRENAALYMRFLNINEHCNMIEEAMSSNGPSGLFISGIAGFSFEFLCFLNSLFLVLIKYPFTPDCVVRQTDVFHKQSPCDKHLVLCDGKDQVHHLRRTFPYFNGKLY